MPKEISEQQNKITRIRAMLLSDEIGAEDFKIMKTECEEKIIRLEAALKDLKANNEATTDLTALVEEALNRLKKLAELYKNGNIEQKRYIIGSIYPENGRFLILKVEPKKLTQLRYLSIRLIASYGIKKPELELKLELSPARYAQQDSNL